VRTIKRKGMEGVHGPELHGPERQRMVGCQAAVKIRLPAFSFTSELRGKRPHSTTESRVRVASISKSP
jgi:hypothetical protein